LRQPYIRQTGGKPVVRRRNDRCYWRTWGGVGTQREVQVGIVFGRKWGKNLRWEESTSVVAVARSICTYVGFLMLFESWRFLCCKIRDREEKS